MTKEEYENIIRLIYAYDRASDGSQYKKLYMLEIKNALRPFIRNEP